MEIRIAVEPQLIIANKDEPYEITAFIIQRQSPASLRVTWTCPFYKARNGVFTSDAQRLQNCLDSSGASLQNGRAELIILFKGFASREPLYVTNIVQINWTGHGR